MFRALVPVGLRASVGVSAVWDDSGSLFRVADVVLLPESAGRAVCHRRWGVTLGGGLAGEPVSSAGGASEQRWDDGVAG